ncbi:MAG: M23 family metallopeptidase, partial [Pseudomonadota bacterium]
MTVPSTVQAPTPHSTQAITNALGDEPAILGTRGRRKPDRRQVSLRWMSGTILTAISSTFLMGGALYAAFDGREAITQSPNTLANLTPAASQSGVIKGDRPTAIVAEAPKRERILQVPTLSTTQGVGVVRKRPFAFVEAPLAVAGVADADYPKFNALTIFRTSSKKRARAKTSDVIYAADVEGEVRIRETDFDPSVEIAFAKDVLPEGAVATTVLEAKRTIEANDTKGAAQVTVDMARFSLDETIAPPTALDIRVSTQNESQRAVIEPDAVNTLYVERVVAISDPQTLRAATQTFAFKPGSADAVLRALEAEFGTDPLSAGTKLRIAYREERDAFNSESVKRTPKRISVYRGGVHLKTAALKDDASVVWAAAPAPIPAIAQANAIADLSVATVTNANLPTLYDGIYRAGLSQGLSKDQVKQIVRTVAFDVEFKRRIKPDDRLEIFHSLEPGQTKATAASQVLYIALTAHGVRRQYYRFQARKDGGVDYYDENGKSAKKFLLRKPVPNGRFTSPFGPRRHPISRVMKMHRGIDFAAPRGTPIIAAGNGIVEKAGWAGGYGRQIILRHANGYKTSYNHLHRYAKISKPGNRIRQGQIIGTVGSSGYSTGPHLHYEVLVNGRRVNPLKIR